MSKALKMSSLLDKFRGCMIGGVIGDCLGSPMECQHWEGIDPSAIKRFFNDYRTEASKSHPQIYLYTDDTAMARQVAESLITSKGTDANDLAKRFWTEYTNEPWRGYGQNVVQVFKKLKVNSKLSSDMDPFLPASEQFNGKGSYGNGAAMRVHPVGLFFSDIDSIKSAAEISAKITHSNDDGINGAVLQALSTHCALRDMNAEEHTKVIQDAARKFEPGNKELTYSDQINRLIEMLDSDVHDFKNGYKFGNSVSALESVPTAIYSYLRAQKDVAGLDTKNAFERTLQLAISFGGDSDTISSMAGALAGARYGEKAIPDYMKSVCEAVEFGRLQADKIFEMSSFKSIV